jgi:hypothetical protein
MTINMIWLFFVLNFDFPPQSLEAWQSFVNQGQTNITSVYLKVSEGLVCQRNTYAEVRTIIEGLANDAKVHPAQIAEEMAVYLWDDWTLLHVEGYDTREVLSNTKNKEALEMLLEQFYKQHQVCLFGILKVLTQGYEGYYSLKNGTFTRSQTPTGEKYSPYALEPSYFPGTGLLEPLGLVYAVKLGDLLTIGWVRERAISIIAETLQRRAKTSSDPLKVRRK